MKKGLWIVAMCLCLLGSCAHGVSTVNSASPSPSPSASPSTGPSGSTNPSVASTSASPSPVSDSASTVVSDSASPSTSTSPSASTSASTSVAVAHAITSSVTGSGTVTFSKEEALAGETITVTLTAGASELFSSIASDQVSLTVGEEGKTYTFVMPDAAVVINVVFRAKVSYALRSLINNTTYSDIAFTKMTAGNSYEEQQASVLDVSFPSYPIETSLGEVFPAMVLQVNDTFFDVTWNTKGIFELSFAFPGKETVIALSVDDSDASGFTLSYPKGTDYQILGIDEKRKYLHPSYAYEIKGGHQLTDFAVTEDLSKKDIPIWEGDNTLYRQNDYVTKLYAASTLSFKEEDAKLVPIVYDTTVTDVTNYDSLPKEAYAGAHVSMTLTLTANHFLHRVLISDPDYEGYRYYDHLECNPATNVVRFTMPSDFSRVKLAFTVSATLGLTMTSVTHVSSFALYKDEALTLPATPAEFASAGYGARIDFYCQFVTDTGYAVSDVTVPDGVDNFHCLAQSKNCFNIYYYGDDALTLTPTVVDTTIRNEVTGSRNTTFKTLSGTPIPDDYAAGDLVVLKVSGAPGTKVEYMDSDEVTFRKALTAEGVYAFIMPSQEVTIRTMFASYIKFALKVRDYTYIKSFGVAPSRPSSKDINNREKTIDVLPNVALTIIVRTTTNHKIAKIYKTTSADPVSASTDTTTPTAAAASETTVTPHGILNHL
jgi:hypothetical protein